jgi:hypothetical protein
MTSEEIESPDKFIPFDRVDFLGLFLTLKSVENRNQGRIVNLNKTVVLPNCNVFVREVLMHLFPGDFRRSRTQNLRQMQEFLNQFMAEE